MKEGLFNSKWYFEDSFFEKEKENLFLKNWIFAGLTNWTKKNGDFFTIPLCGNDIVVHNLNGEIKSYLNVCPHRGGPLVQGVFGNSMPVCKYHGWSFREGKELTGQSNHEWFSNDGSQDSCGRKLLTIHTKIIGPLIFINQSKLPLDFNEQFNSNIIEKFLSIGNISDTAISEFNSAMNWKLNMENVKDPLHIYYIHPQSFSPLLAFEKSTPKIINFSSNKLAEYSNDVKLIDLSFTRTAPFSSNDLWIKKHIKITQPENQFENIYLFPSTNYYSVSGGYYVFQQYLPVDSKNFTYRLIIALPEKVTKFDSSALLNTLLKLERNVINEDNAVLSRVQNNLESLSEKSYFTHGDYETEIMDQMLYLANNVYC
jgi:phenylpropionate dioxygenase-like ring-hydroxylating dioxygenase large terminal subunit